MTFPRSTPLKRLAAINPETLPEDTDPMRVIAYLDIGAVGHGKLVETPRSLAFGEAPSRARRVVTKGDVILSTVGTTPRAVLSVDSFLDGAVVSTGFAVVRSVNMDARFLGWAVQATPFIDDVAARSAGVVYPAIAPSSLSVLRLWEPSAQAQRLIADFLDRETARIDELVAKKRKMIDLLDEERSSLVTVVATKGMGGESPLIESDSPWIGPYPSHWEVRPIRALGEGARGFVDGDWVELPYITDGGVRLIQTGNIGVGLYREQGFRYISEQSFDQLGCTEVRPGDLLICRLADPAGRACVAPDLGGPMIAAVDVSILKPRVGVHAPYFAALFSSSRYLGYVATEARGGTRGRVSRSWLGALRVPVPPFDEQVHIASYLDARAETTSLRISVITRQLDLVAEYRQALITAAVTGRLDEATLRGEKPVEETTGVEVG